MSDCGTGIANRLISDAYSCVVDPLKANIVIFWSLEENAQLLSGEERRLDGLKEDVYGKLEEHYRSDPHSKPSRQVNEWLTKVGDFLSQSASFSDSFASRAPSCSFRFGCISNYKLAKRAVELLKDGTDLHSEWGKFIIDTHPLIIAARPTAKEIPIGTEVVGQGGQVLKTLDLINGDADDIIGICGMGGIGKTILIECIYNHFCRNPRGFDIVLLVCLEKDMNIERIRGEIRRKLGLRDRNGVDDDILRYLEDKSFLLLMDNVWDSLNLKEIGIPLLSSERKRKIVLTTRKASVCSEMGIKKESIVSVGLLTPEQSWKLFCLHVNNEDIKHDPSIEPSARDIAKRCGGLPLALSVVGTAMAAAKTDSEWKNDKKELEHSAHAFEGMSSKVLSKLKFSYDRLGNDAMREIVLYCSLYPQGHNIVVEDLIGMLMEEGLLDTDSIPRDHAPVRLRTWITKIIDSGLFLRQQEDSVKLHACVHDMAVWLTSGKSTLFVRSPQRFAKGKDLDRFVRGWQKAKRISMVYSDIKSIPDFHVHSPCCDCLVTLLWEMGTIARIPVDFFEYVPHLRVLNLSNTAIEELPSSIGALTRLKYLNLQSTPIERLPEELGKLMRLVQLILRDAKNLRHIPPQSISRMHKLERLDLLGTNNYLWRWSKDYTEESTVKLGLEDLDRLARCSLSNIGISIQFSPQLARDISSSKNLSSSIIQLELSGRHQYLQEDDDLLRALSNQIQILRIHCDGFVLRDEFPDLSELSLSDVMNVAVEETCDFKELSNLYITQCWYLQSWLPSIVERIAILKVLHIHTCYEVESLLGYDVKYACFPCLKELQIWFCKQLREISDHTLELRSLEELDVRGCDGLYRLPFGEGSAPRLQRIKGTTEWWDGLEWKDEGIKSKFLPCFIPIHN